MLPSRTGSLGCRSCECPSSDHHVQCSNSSSCHYNKENSSCEFPSRKMELRNGSSNTLAL
jgi:hypothetical protein